MKYIFKSLSLLVLFFIIHSCSSVKIISDVNKDTDFKQFKTYRWATSEQPLNKSYPQFDNSLNRQRIKNAIDSAMKDQGFILDEGMADLEVDFHIQFKQNKVPYHSLNYDEGDFYSGVRTDEIYSYDEGMLTIHLIDLKQKQLVWQGIGSKVLDVTKLDTAEANINENISKIFDKFSSQISR